MTPPHDAANVAFEVARRASLALCGGHVAGGGLAEAWRGGGAEAGLVAARDLGSECNAGRLDGARLLAGTRSLSPSQGGSYLSL